MIIHAYSMGYINVRYGMISVYGCLLKTEYHEFKKSGLVETKRIKYRGVKTMKKYADLMSVYVVLQCIKDDADIKLYTPPGYAYDVLERSVYGRWMYNTKQNRDLVDKVRSIVLSFSNIDIEPISLASDEFHRCIKLAKAELYNATN